MRNVWAEWPCSVKHYILHPWKIVVQFFRNWKMARQRARRGWCDRDWWNMDYWFLEVVPDMLRALAENCHGFPDGDDFPTYDSWVHWLNDIADRLSACTEDAIIDANEYKDAWLNADSLSSPELKKYFARSEEIYAERDKDMQECMAQLAKHMRSLWD